MMRMGVWTENLSLPVVLNECCLQSYSGKLHLFPNTKNLGPARFANLRAAGAFLVSAAWDGQAVSTLHIVSEKGRPLHIVNPWRSSKAQAANVRQGSAIEVSETAGAFEFQTVAGEEYTVRPI
jgi:hypothetical protein